METVRSDQNMSALIEKKMGKKTDRKKERKRPPLPPPTQCHGGGTFRAQVMQKKASLTRTLPAGFWATGQLCVLFVLCYYFQL